ncbi:MAG: aminoacyl-tRNA hydrolase [Planctomycetes bacterium]|nr:aminoacyl-tRNA hydrolase [Planctomycetota bacterium]
MIPGGPETVTRLIVGLGNPGPRYDGTRHNVGFDVVRRLRARLQRRGWSVRGPFARFDAASPDFDLYSPDGDGSEDPGVITLEPGRFMNRSGEPTIRALEDCGLGAQDVLVVYDDLDLPLGQLRVRRKGSSAGHRGVEDILRALGTDRFDRLKVGIGRPDRSAVNDEGETVVDWVLEPFDPGQRKVIEAAIEAAAAACETWCRQGAIAAMNEFNGYRPPTGDETERTEPEAPRRSGLDTTPSRSADPSAGNQPSGAGSATDNATRSDDE